MPPHGQAEPDRDGNESTTPAEEGKTNLSLSIKLNSTDSTQSHRRETKTPLLLPQPASAHLLRQLMEADSHVSVDGLRQMERIMTATMTIMARTLMAIGTAGLLQEVAGKAATRGQRSRGDHLLDWRKLDP